MTYFLRTVATVFALAAASTLPAANVDPDALGLHWVWSENAAWIDAQPDGAEGPGLQLTDAAVSGWLWSANIGWISAHCVNTESCADVDYGLRLQPDTQKPGWLLLVGKAWSENTGWIVSHCLETDSCDDNYYGLRIDIATGLVQGYAWSENMGWLNFTCDNASSCADVNFGLQFDPDTLAFAASGGIFKDSYENLP